MKSHYYITTLLLLTFISIVSGKNAIFGYVIDTDTKEPISQVEVTIQGTDVKTLTDDEGKFRFPNDVICEEVPYELSVTNKRLQWQSDKEIDIQIFNILGQRATSVYTSIIGTGEISLQNIANGIFFIVVYCQGQREVYKINPGLDRTLAGKKLQTYNTTTSSEDLSTSSDTLMLSKNGFFTQKYAYKTAHEKYELLNHNVEDISYLDKIIRKEAFVALQGRTLSPSFSEVKTVKVIYSIAEDKIYYANTQKYIYHYYFCTEELEYDKGATAFNNQQYQKNDNRLYFLGTLNHYTASDTYTLQYFAGDELDCIDIENVYNRIIETTFIGDKLKFFANKTDWMACDYMQKISANELYEGQNYQSLNPVKCYGYLRKIPIDNLSYKHLGKHDIVLINEVPNDISVVAGIITTKFQTPLSHINVLSHNRRTPNMALRDGWTNPKLNDLLDKLVYLNVGLDSFNIREANIEEAKAFWDAKEPQETKILDIDTLTSGLINLTTANVNSVSLIGGKASNFAELMKVTTPNAKSLTVPEGAFAIPFYYYQQHIKKYGLDTFIEEMLEDVNFQTNSALRQTQLEILRDSIKHSPIDVELLQLVETQISENNDFNRYRFRSSTNAEDIEGFNGAGLYDSKTGALNDSDKPIDKAIKKVWASLWNFSAFEEREYFKIDHRSIAMGILSHRSFPSEEANGVVITKNIYRQGSTAITINVQVGEIRVVDAEEAYVPDQIIYYKSDNERVIEYVNHSNVPALKGKTVMTDDELEELRNYCLAIQDHYCQQLSTCDALDIEFKVDIVDNIRQIYIKQARLY